VIGGFAVEQLSLLDGPAVAAVIRGKPAEEVAAEVDARRSDPSWRVISQECGLGLARLAADVADTPYARAVRARRAVAAASVMHSDLARSLGVDAELAVLVEMRSTVAAMLQATVRLAALSAIAAQQQAVLLRPRLLEAVSRSLSATELRDPGALPGTHLEALPSALFRS
jgi:urease accessory protein UreF